MTELSRSSHTSRFFYCLCFAVYSYELSISLRRFANTQRPDSFLVAVRALSYQPTNVIYVLSFQVFRTGITWLPLTPSMVLIFEVMKSESSEGVAVRTISRRSPYVCVS
jgi:hypothetical protein